MPRDKRFADPAWKQSSAYRRWRSRYLAWGGALNRFVDEASMEKRDTERARFVVSLVRRRDVADQFAAGNPAALKKSIDTGGASLAQAWRIWSTTSRTTAACRHRSIDAASSRSARTSPPRPARWCTATR